jgi:hypothetical protein
VAFSQSDLAQITQRVSLARERLERQRAVIQKLAKSGGDTNDAVALFRTMRRRLEALEQHRREIEDELYSATAQRG